MTETILFFPKR